MRSIAEKYGWNWKKVTESNKVMFKKKKKNQRNKHLTLSVWLRDDNLMTLFIQPTNIKRKGFEAISFEEQLCIASL